MYDNGQINAYRKESAKQDVSRGIWQALYRYVRTIFKVFNSNARISEYRSAIGVCIGSSSSRWVVLARILVIIQINTQTHAHLHARTHSRTYVYTHTRARDTPHGVYNFHLSITAGHLELKWKKSWCSTFFLFLFFSLSLREISFANGELDIAIDV